MMRGMSRAPVLLACVVVAAACGGSNRSLKLTLLDASVQRPSNVAVYFTVETASGEPVAGLAAERFQIYEDGQPVSVLESKQTILNPEVAAAHYLLLLIDMSASVSESDDVNVIVDGARQFGARVQKYQKVAVYAFDGSPSLHRVVGFTAGPQEAIEQLSGYRPRDPSTNLNGAILEALKTLRSQMRSSPLPLTFGTLVVFTDGTDRAHRVPRERVHEELALAEMDVMVIGVGNEIDEGELRSIGKDGAILSKDRAQIAQAFEQMAARVEAHSKRYYLLGYCSPARAGDHEVTIETAHGGNRGALAYRFSAASFGPDCDPTRKPSFSLRRARASR
jgi:hypothetical protein